MNTKLKVAIIGLGNRGKDTYAKVIQLYKEQLELSAVADIDPQKVEDVKITYSIPDSHCFSSAEELLEKERLADVLFICTQDRQHVRHAIPALQKGYHLLLEKPVSPDLEECREIVRVAEEKNRKVAVCHVLRYTPFYNKIKEILDSGTIGRIMSIQAIENVGYYHQAHSFVRGNWANSNETSPMILQKCCHDMDIFVWLTGKTCEFVSSFGSLDYFKEENAPKGSTLCCLDGCEVKDSCPYDAEKIYIQDEKMGIAHGHKGWPNNVLTLHPTVESITEALKKGPYGRCVFHCGNNVVDHQVVNMSMEDGCTISFTMCGFTSENSRAIKIMGTIGDIVADMQTNKIEVTPFGKKTETIDVNKLSDDFSGHGGGDNRMIKEVLNWILSGEKPSGNLTSLDRSIESHYIAMAAEKSRMENGTMIRVADLR